MNVQYLHLCIMWCYAYGLSGTSEPADYTQSSCSFIVPLIKIALWLQFGGVQYMQHTKISETQSVSLDTSNWTILCRAWKDEARTTFKSEVRLVSELISIQIQTSKCFFSRMKAMPSPAVGSSHLWQTSFHLYLMIPSDKWITPKTYLLEMFEWNWHILFH